MRVRRAMPATLLGLCTMVLLSSPVRTSQAEVPASFPDWKVAIERSFRNRGTVDVRRFEAPAPVHCSRSKGTVRTYQDSFLPGGVRASIRPEDTRRFAVVRLMIRPLKPGADIAAFLSAVARRQGKPPHCFVSKEAHLQFAWAGHFIELFAGCAAGDMVYYEAGDLLDWLESLEPGAVPDRVFFSRCGQMELVQVETSWLRAQARRQRTFFGLEFPDARR